MSKKFLGNYTKAQVTAYVRMKLETSDEWCMKACLRLYKCQTQREKKQRLTCGRDKIGFNKFDAPILCDIAIRIKKLKDESLVNFRDMILMKALLSKYSRQVIAMSDKKILLTVVEAYYKRKSKIPY